MATRWRAPEHRGRDRLAPAASPQLSFPSAQAETGERSRGAHRWGRAAGVLRTRMLGVTSDDDGCASYVFMQR